VELVTQTLNETVVEEATKEINELFSIDPQKAVVNWGQEFAVYVDAVLPQYPFKSQIGVALAQSFPAGGFPTQFGGGGGATTHIENVPVPPA
jgi:hypothetical protein